MGKVIQGELLGQGKKFAIVISRFNEFITSRLLWPARRIASSGTAWRRRTLTSSGCRARSRSRSPPCASPQTHRYDAVVCLGAVIRGQTPHFDYIAAEVSKGVAQVAMASGVPTIFGVITSDTIEQAVERAGTKAGNKGADAAASAIEMANLFGKLPKAPAKK